MSRSFDEELEIHCSTRLHQIFLLYRTLERNKGALHRFVLRVKDRRNGAAKADIQFHGDHQDW